MEDLNEAINIKKVIKSLGIDAYECNTAFWECPICKEKKCLSIDTERKRVYCSECNFYGDAIDLMTFKDDLCYDDTIMKLAKMFFVEMEYQEPKTLDKKPLEVTLEKRVARLEKDLEEFNEKYKLLEKVVFELVSKDLNDSLEKINKRS